jgi:hypothetical protein
MEPTAEYINAKLT